VYNAIDDFVMTNLGTYNKRPLKSAESADLDLDKETSKKGDDKENEAKKGLSEAEVRNRHNSKSMVCAVLIAALSTLMRTSWKDGI